jgi:P-type Cu+ transporter
MAVEEKTSAAEKTAIDPVCGMAVNPATAKHKADADGDAFYFCCAGCREKFLVDPRRYADPVATRSPAPKADHAAKIYVCPMHPQIRQDRPGACPICGMALEPEFAGQEEEPNGELAAMSRRFWIGLALTAPVLFIGMGGHLFDLNHVVGARWLNWLELVLATPTVLWAGAPFFVRAGESLRRRSPNMFTLIGLGVGAAWLYSVAATLAPDLFPAGFRESNGAVPVYFEAAATIVVLVLLGQMLELRARQQTGAALRALLDLSPKTARRIATDGAESDVPLEEVCKGDRLRVRPGEKIPVDGVLIEGRGLIDESMVTGEPMEASRTAGERVVGGAVNRSGGFVMQAEKVGRDTLLARIVALVAEAQRSRAPIQSVADAAAGWLVPLVVIAAAAAFVAWSLWGPEPRFAYALLAAVSVLIIACPCALGLATPMSIMVGIGRAAQLGVLIRNAEAIQRLERIDVLVVDKTGTLTEGRPKLTALRPAPGFSEDDVLRLAASVERASEHPLGAALVRAAEERGLQVRGPERFASVAGKGATGLVDGRRVTIGNRAMMEEAGADLSQLNEAAAQISEGGATLVYVAVDERAAGALAIADPVKRTSAAAIQALRRSGVRVVLATGDEQAAAEAAGRAVGLADIRARVLPTDKAQIVNDLRGQGFVTAFAGDGINDAPALAAADVGIAMGEGTDIAIETAGVTLLGGDLSGIVRGRALSRATMRNIRQNLVFAFVYNLAGVPIAAGALYPKFGLLLSPAVAAAAMSLSSASVVFNALRLRNVRSP